MRSFWECESYTTAEFQRTLSTRIPIPELPVEHYRTVQLPSHFRDIFESGKHLRRLNNSIFSHLDSICSLCNHDRPDQLRTFLPEYRRLLRQWKDITTASNISWSPIIDDRQASALLVCQEAFYSFILILINTKWSSDENVFDGYESEFRTTLALCEEYLILEKEIDGGSSVEPTFRLNPRVSTMVTFIGLRCRNHSIREIAVRLLEDYRHEEQGISSAHLAQWIRSVTKIEEGQVSKPRNSTDVPANVRVRPLDLCYLPGTAVSSSDRSVSPGSDSCLRMRWALCSAAACRTESQILTERCFTDRSWLHATAPAPDDDIWLLQFDESRIHELIIGRLWLAW